MFPEPSVRPWPARAAAPQNNRPKAQEVLADLQGQLAACRKQCPESDFGGDLEQQLHHAQTAEAAAAEQLAACQARQQQARQARQGLSRDYHPFDLADGRPLEAEEVGRRLSAHFDTLEQIASEANLSARSTKQLAKARRVLKAMTAAISFFGGCSAFGSPVGICRNRRGNGCDKN
jgi:hypothetical protein